ncbi:maleylacetoacetate isomerase, partial [Escherichia coli]
LTAQFGADQPARDAWYAHWIVLGFEALEAMAAPAPFLGGATPSIADICFVPQMYNARRFNIPLNGYPKLVAADAAASAHPAFI